MRELNESEWRILLNRDDNLCFSGYRAEKLPDLGDELTARLRGAIKDAISRGRNTFLHGAINGFDLLAAKQVILLKEIYPRIKCVTIAPFRTGYFSQNNWTKETKQRLLRVSEQSDLNFSIQERY